MRTKPQAPIIAVVGHHLTAVHLPVAAEAGLLIAATAIGCWATFEIVRRVDLLRPLFGLGTSKRIAAAPLDRAPA